MTPTGTPTQTSSSTSTFSIRATASNTPDPSSLPIPSFVPPPIWAPAGCGSVPVPAYSQRCALGWLNTTVVQVSLPVTGINATALLASANVWDAWASAFARQLAVATGIPPQQLQPVFASRCPPPPLWIGASTYAAYLAAPPVDCVTLEFVEVRSAVLAMGLTARAALYRIACAVGAYVDPSLVGNFLPLPLAANGVTPASYLLAPLWKNAVDATGTPINRFAAGTWRFTATAQQFRGAAPSIIPNQIAFPGRLDGRLLDLPYLTVNSGVRRPGDNPDNVPALKGFLGTFIVLFVAAVAFIVHDRNKVNGAVTRQAVTCLQVMRTHPLRALGLSRTPAGEVELLVTKRGRAGSALAASNAAARSPMAAWEEGAVIVNPIARITALRGGGSSRFAEGASADPSAASTLREGARFGNPLASPLATSRARRQRDASGGDDGSDAEVARGGRGLDESREHSPLLNAPGKE